MIAGIILAGGQGRRLGGVDKAFLRVGGHSLLAHVLARLTPQVDAVAISANGDPARFADFSFPVLADGTFAGKGPLAGVLAGLDWAGAVGARAMLSVPVDTPFIPLDLVAKLGLGPSVAMHDGRQHHLVAMWPVTARTTLAAFLRPPGAYRVRDALAACGAKPVVFEASSEPFLNVNIPQDLIRARQEASTSCERKEAKKLEYRPRAPRGRLPPD